jgi:hypothetical protein
MFVGTRRSAMPYRLINRTGEAGNHRFDTFAFTSFGEAEQFASTNDTDYVIEDDVEGGGVLRYRLSGFEMN